MILADTHMLGPFRGHPWDKLRREWQMKRSFQTSMQFFEPDLVFILGDVFDEGNWVDNKGFQEYVDRFNTIFYTPKNTRMFPIHGNHDVNFHYSMHPHLINRFNSAFNVSGISLIKVRKVNFITINSMAMEDDGCDLCEEAKETLKSISKEIKKDEISFVLQHFPTYRESDEMCIEKNSINNEKYREKWETLSKDASEMIEKLINPRAYFSGHTHHYCLHKNKKGINEYTLASFNWRNINNPSFLLAIFSDNDFSISKCDMPKESTVYLCYAIGVFLSIIIALLTVKRQKFNKSKKN